jgi:antitoxin MazE
MEVPIIKIGNSWGIRLSKTLLKRYNMASKVELLEGEDAILIKPISEPRQGWDEAFARMAENGDDKPLIDDVFEDEDFGEWK